MAAMKWAGWGEDEVAFTHEDKPALGPFLERHLDIEVARAGAAAPSFGALAIPEPSLPDALRGALERATKQVSTDPRDRVVHARGKSLRDLVRHRSGDLGRLPDVVVRPADEDEVVAIMQAALDADAVLIPFGGGTSISGSLEARESERRPVISLDVTAMRKVLAIDARVRARARPGRRVRPGPRAPAQRAGLDPRPLPGQLHALDARRLDRHALVRDAVRPLRRHRRPDARGARRDADRRCW